MGSNPRLIYWKWADTILEPGVLAERVGDLLSRSSFDVICVAAHWVKLPVTDSELVAKVSEACELLHKAGRKLVLELDVRNEYEGFNELYPDDCLYAFFFAETTLDDRGCGVIEFDSPLAYHYWRSSGVKGIERILGCWAFDLTEKRAIARGSLRDISDKTRFEVIGERTRIEISAGPDYADSRAAALPAFRQAIPNLFSPRLYAFYEQLFDAYAHIPLDGVLVDEWGVDVMIGSIDATAATRCLTYADQMAELYQRHCGRSLRDDLILLKYPVDGLEQRAYQAVNDYNHVLRSKMVENETWFYDQGKRVYGPQAFIGAHPTWWGDRTRLHLEVLKNGWDWWEVPRDYAQTDETISIPIRLALARKCGGPVWYNMWYSMGTRRLDTYFAETWRNARYGGRTHYHGYECPNEEVVLELKGQGMLEQIEETEKAIAEVEELQAGQPDSRILVVFGMQAVSNWVMNQPGLEMWSTSSPTQDRVLELSLGLFEAGHLHDLVPSTEIENGSVRIENGRLCYGDGHAYDALIFLFPENVSAKVWSFLQDYRARGGRIAGCGKLTCLDGGQDVRAAFDEWAGTLDSWWAELADVSALVEALVETVRRWGLRVDNFKQGCMFTDGSAVFTASGPASVGNPLDIAERVNGHLVEFKGKDYLVIKLTAEGDLERLCSGECESLRIDGVDVVGGHEVD